MKLKKVLLSCGAAWFRNVFITIRKKFHCSIKIFYFGFHFRNWTSTGLFFVSFAPLTTQPDSTTDNLFEITDDLSTEQALAIKSKAGFIEPTLPKESCLFLMMQRYYHDNTLALKRVVKLWQTVITDLPWHKATNMLS